MVHVGSARLPPKAFKKLALHLTNYAIGQTPYYYDSPDVSKISAFLEP
jgi:hypothetical protein